MCTGLLATGGGGGAGAGAGGGAGEPPGAPSAGPSRRDSQASDAAGGEGERGPGAAGPPGAERAGAGAGSSAPLIDKHVIAVTRRMSQQLTVDEHWKQVQITHMTNTQHQSISAMQRLERQLEVLALTPSQRTDDDLKILEDLLLGVKFAAALPLAKQHEI